MKLSDFRNKSIAKKLQYVNGEATIVEYDKLDGEINFYALDEELLLKINNELMSKLSKDEKDETLMYKLIPYLSNVEVDVSIEEFTEMLNSTNKNLIKFIEILMMMINDALEMADSVKNIQSTANNIVEKVGTPIESDEDKLDKLYIELENASNRNQRRRLMKEISDLEMKMNINE